MLGSYAILAILAPILTCLYHGHCKNNRSFRYRDKEAEEEEQEEKPEIKHGWSYYAIGIFFTILHFVDIGSDIIYLKTT